AGVERTDVCNGITVDPNGHLYVSGYSQGPTPFGPHPLTSAGGNDVFVAKYDPHPAVTVSAAPVDPPVVIGPGGGAFSFAVTLTNVTDQPQTFQAWTAATGPANRPLVYGPITITLPPGASRTREIRQRVPANAPAGTYTYHVRLGTFPSVSTSASFPCEKEPGVLTVSEDADGAGAWLTSGWEAMEATGASAEAGLPGGFALSEPHPNPSASAARLTLDLAEAQAVTAEVLDALGRRVALL